MNKRLLVAVISVCLFASPLLVSAQSFTFHDCSTTPTVSCLQSEIAQLVQILEQLLAAHGTSLPAGSPLQTTLTINNNKYTTTGSQKGSVYLCQLVPPGPAATGTGPWINTQAGTWTPSQKIAVQGTVSWPNAYVNISVNGNTRTITSNDLPVGATTGIFPIRPSDPAYQYDTNPDSITPQNISISLPADPTVASSPSCINNEVGIMTNGVLILHALDRQYRDAVPNEVQDSCGGHPHEGGVYHYHGLSPCIPNATVSTVIGYAFDGFPITGPQLPNGNYLTSADLDECHGMTSSITLDGKTVTMYHYVMTQDFPYSVSCFRGKSYEPAMPGMSMTPPQGTLTPSPSSGAAPLSVSLVLTFPSNTSPPATGSAPALKIDFGDGTSGTIASTTNNKLGATHVYAIAGTYAATVSNGTATLASTTITVVSQSSGSVLAAVPQFGAAPLSVSFSTSPLSAYDSYTLSFGDGATGLMTLLRCDEQASGGSNCAYSASHTYTANGTYTATLYQSPGVFDGSMFFGCQNNGHCAGLAIENVTVIVTGKGQNTF
jgi:YHYH protein